MDKGIFKISGVGIKPSGKNNFVVRVRFANGEVVTLTGRQVRYADAIRKIQKENSRARLVVPGASIKMH